MKTKQKNVCHTCRAHKIGCDGKKPSCSQCHHTGRQCRGYQTSAVFVSYSPGAAATVTSGKARKSRSDIPAQTIDYGVAEAYTAQLQQCSVPGSVNVAALEKLTAVVVRSFIPRDKLDLLPLDLSASQVCGAWVSVLPRLASEAKPGELVSLAIRAFGTAILNQNRLDRTADYQSLEAYTTLIQQLRTSLAARETIFDIQIAVAMLCLALVEFLIPTPHETFYDHLKGLGALVRSQNPQGFSSDVLHAFFIGCRPVLLFQALHERTGTFLAQSVWIDIPFRKHQPSAMQNLLSVVATLPSLLHDIDSLPGLSHDVAVSKSRSVGTELLKIYSVLSRWLAELKKDGIYHLKPIQDSGPPPIFPSLLNANLHTHAWAFQIICITEIRKVRLFISSNGGAAVEAKTIEDGDLLASKLAIKICHSMEYVLQDEMELYGPISALFPLEIAYDTLYKTRYGQGTQIDYCKDLIARIRRKGILGWPHFCDKSC